MSSSKLGMMGCFSIDEAPIYDTQQSDEHGVPSAWTSADSQTSPSLSTTGVDPSIS